MSPETNVTSLELPLLDPIRPLQCFPIFSNGLPDSQGHILCRSALVCKTPLTCCRTPELTCLALQDAKLCHLIHAFLLVFIFIIYFSFILARRLLSNTLTTPQRLQLCPAHAFIYFRDVFFFLPHRTSGPSRFVLGRDSRGITELP